MSDDSLLQKQHQSVFVVFFCQKILLKQTLFSFSFTYDSHVKKITVKCIQLTEMRTNHITSIFLLDQCRHNKLNKL